MMFKKGIVVNKLNDSKDFPIIQVRYDAYKVDDMVLLNPAGVNNSPKINEKGLVLCVDADKFFLPMNYNNRKKVENGEFAIGDNDCYVLVDKEKKIVMKNTLQSLKTLIDTLIDTIVSLQTIPAVVGVQLTLDPSVIASLNQIKSDFGELLNE